MSADGIRTARLPFCFSSSVNFGDGLIKYPARIMAHHLRGHSATIRHAITTMKTIASASICLLNDFMRSSSSLMRLASFVAQLSPEAIKKLEDLREGWQSTRVIDFSRLLLVTKLVAIGVILEGPEIILEIAKAVNKRWGASRRWREKSAEDHIPDWIKVIGLVGWVLVSIGVAGEFWVDSWVNTDDEHIQSINITLLQDAGASASQARTAADGAVSRSDDAKKKAEAVLGIAAKANESATSAFATAGDAKAQLATVDAKIQTTEANVERVDEKFSFRELDPRKRSLFIEALKNAPHKPTEPVQMEAFMSVVDGTTYGSEIGDAMNDPSTGWKAGQTAASSLSGGCKGVVLSVRVGTASVPLWALDLQQALEVSGIGGAFSLSRDQPEGTVRILVCPKN